jgi:hypothetical protein
MPATIPLITTAAGIAYDQLVSKPERESAADKITGINQAAYDKQVAERAKYSKAYEEFLNTPVQAYDEEIIKTKLAVVNQQIKDSTAAERPKILQSLATRGVRTSGIGQESLNALDQKNATTYGNAVSSFTLEQLIAQRQAEQVREQQKANYYGTMIGAAPSNTGVVNSQTNQALMPLYNDQMLQGLLKYLGMSTAYALQPGATNPAATASPTVDWTTLNLYNRNMGLANNGPTSLIKSNQGAFTN